MFKKKKTANSIDIISLHCLKSLRELHVAKLGAQKSNKAHTTN